MWNGDAAAAAGEAHHRLQHQALTLLDVLAHGVQIGGELHAGGEEGLAVLALGLAEELLPPLAEEAEGGLVSHQDLHLLAQGVQGVPGGGVLPGRIVRAGGGEGLHGLGGALHQGGDIHPGAGDGQQAHGGEDGIAAAHRVGHHKLLIALRVGQALQGPLVGVGGGVDAPAGPLLAVLLLQQGLEDAEGYCRLGGSARLGDDIDGEVLVLHQLDDLQHGVGGEAVAGKVDVGPALVGQVEIGGVEQLHHRAGAQIGAADADDHQGLGVAADALRRRLDAGKLLLVVVPGQVNPAGIRAAQAAALLQLDAGALQRVQPAGQPVLGQKRGAVGSIQL